MQALTLKEVAIRLGVSPRTVESWASSGSLPTVNVSRDANSRKPRLRVLVGDLDAFIATRRSVASTTKRKTRRPAIDCPSYV